MNKIKPKQYMGGGTNLLNDTNLPIDIASNHIMTSNIKLQGVIIPQYTKIEYKTAGTFSWKVPANVTKVKVTGCGGGAGGCTTSCYNTPGHDAHVATAGDGGDSKFKDFIIAGGKGATCSSDWGTDTGNLWCKQPAASTPNGIAGDYWVGGQRDFDIYGVGFELSTSKKVCAANSTNQGKYYGQGGQTHHFYDSDGYTYHSGAAGNSGAWDSKIVTVIPEETVTIVVGAAGKLGSNYCDSDRWRYFATNGTAGFIIIEFGDTIE